MTEERKMVSDRQLMRMAMEMTKRSYAPFSKFRVGAALLAKDGCVYTGCNVENSSFGGTICAERTAFVKAISEGCREFEKIAITASPVPETGAGEGVGTAEAESGEPVYVEAWPCGICRQFMKEFCDDDFVIITGTGADSMRTMTMTEILPEGFRL